MALFYILEGIKSPVLNYIALGFATLGSELIFLCAISLIFWCFSKTAAYKLLFTYVIFGSVINIANLIARIPYPWISQENISVMHVLSENLHGYSVPSIGLFTILLLCIGILVNNHNPLIKTVCVIISCVSTFSYLYLGLCSIASAGVTAFLAVLAVVLFTKFIDSMHFDASRYHVYMVISAIPALVLMCLCVSMYLNGIITITCMAVYLKMVGFSVGLLISWFFECNFVRANISVNRGYKQVIKALIGTSSTVITWIGLYVGFSFIPDFWPAAFICNLLTSVGSFAAYPIFIKFMFSANYN